MKIIKNLYIFIIFLAVLFIFLVISQYGSNVVHADSVPIDEYSLDEVKQLLTKDGKQYTRVYKETGSAETFESPLDSNFIDYFSSKLHSRSTLMTQNQNRSITNPFAVTTIVDSGLLDSQSIVVVFMGDGFTSGIGADQQGTWPNPVEGWFLAQANNAAQTVNCNLNCNNNG